MSLAAKAANSWTVTGNARHMGGRYGNKIHIPQQNQVSTTFPVHVTTWNSGTSDYDWFEVERNTGDTAWAAKTDSRDQDDFANARHFNGWADLPSSVAKPMLAILTILPDVDGDYTPFFDVPVQKDSTFAHRTDPTASPTTGDRKDLTMTTAELTTEAASGALNWSIEGQGADIGVVYTVPSRAMYYEAGSDEIMYGYICDIELDVMGRQISRSEEMRYTIHIPDTC